MTTWYVTRHLGAQQWATENQLHYDQHVSHLDPSQVQKGDIVIGSLPVHLAATVNQRGARYINLTIDTPAELRGKELDTVQMRLNQTRLEEFSVQALGAYQVKDTPLSSTRIHIVLASGESLPNFIPVHMSATKAAHIHIVASGTMKENAEKLRRSLLASGLFSQDITLHPGCPAHDFDIILNWAKQFATKGIQNDTPNARFLLNITGGNKLMALAFLQAFRPYAEIFYCDTEAGELSFLQPGNKLPEKIPVNVLNIDLLFAAQGYARRKEVDRSAEIQCRKMLTQKIATVAPNITSLIDAFNKAANEFNNGGSGPASYPLKGFKHPIEKQLLQQLQEHKLLRQYNGQLVVTNTAAQAYLRGGWLEEWCYLVAKELEQGDSGKRLHASRWGVGIKIDPLSQEQKAGPFNELDAAIIHGNKLLLIECKSGAQVTKKTQDILNKLNMIGTQVGGRLDTKWLITARPITEETALERAKQFKIRIIQPDELAQLKTLIFAWMTKSSTHPLSR